MNKIQCLNIFFTISVTTKYRKNYNSKALAVVCRIMIRRTDESLRTEKRNKSGNVSMVDALTFRHHIQLYNRLIIIHSLISYCKLKLLFTGHLAHGPSHKTNLSKNATPKTEQAGG